MKQEPFFGLTGGQDRSVFPLRANPNNFYTLHNMRQSRNQRGMLEQTPYFIQEAQTSQGTYYDGGSQTEATSSAVRMIAPIPATISGELFQVTDYTISAVGGNQLQVFYQTVQPAGETVYTGCVLVINNVAGLGITLGQDLDVEMTGAATFRWRKNGGGYTAGLVPSTSGVSIDGGNATLYFLANSGFAGTETWSWARTDCSYDNASTVRIRPLPWICDDRATYFVNRNDRVMKVVTAVTSSEDYAISVGYRAVYASYLSLFSDHLYLQDAGTTASAVSARVHIVKNSDKSDYDNFISTDTNEADTNRLPVSRVTVQEQTTGIGLAVLNQYLYAFTSSEIFFTPDLGLPTVSSFQKLGSRPQVVCDGSLAQNVVVATNGVYILSDRRVTLFDGQNATAISDPVKDALVVNSRLHGIYNVTFDELIITDYSQSAPVLYVFQAQYGTWHTRAATFTTGSGPMSFTVDEEGVLFVGIASRKVLIEDVDWAAGAIITPAFDTSGTTWATPTIVTQVGSQRLERVKETAGTYLGVSFNYDDTPAGIGYAAIGNRQAKLGWMLSDFGAVSSTTVTAAQALLTSASVDGWISFPRCSFRGIAYQITFVDSAATKPVAKCAVSAIEPDWIANQVTR